MKSKLETQLHSLWETLGKTVPKLIPGVDLISVLWLKNLGHCFLVDSAPRDNFSSQEFPPILALGPLFLRTSNGGQIFIHAPSLKHSSAPSVCFQPKKLIRS